MTSCRTSGATENGRFEEILTLIQRARQHTMSLVNTQLIELYWQVGACISRKMERAEWGDGVVTQLADHLARTQPGLRGFTRRNLFRMRQFYEAYRGDEKVSALLTQLPWTQNLIILTQAKLPEEREFYLRRAIQERWSTRDLERQLKTALFERSVLSSAKVTPVVTQTHPGVLEVFRDAYPARCRRRWWLSTRRGCRTRHCCKPNCMSSMH